MSNQNNTTSRTSRPTLANYELLYADAIVLLRDALADDQSKPRSFVNANGPVTENVQTGMARRITLLKESYFTLKRTSNNFLFIAQIWTHDSSKLEQTQLEKEQQKYKNLRDDCDVPALEERALERLKDLRSAINNAVEQYNDQNVASERKWPGNVRPRLCLLGPLTELEAAVHERRNADQSDQPVTFADANLQDAFTDSDVVRGSTEATPDQSDQSHIVADANFQALFIDSDEVKGSSDAAPDQSDQSTAGAEVSLQEPFTEDDEVRGLAYAAPDQPDQAHIVADADFQDFLTESDEVRGLTDTAPVQSGQSNDDAKVHFQDPIGNGEVRSATGLPKDQHDQLDAVADVTLQDSFTEIKEIKGSTDAAPDQSDQPSAIANASFQDPFAENSERVRNSAVGDGSSLSGVCDADEYAISVQTLAAMLQELDEHRDSFNKGFVQSDEHASEQVIQVLKGASNRVSTIAKKWMKKAATDPVRYRTESQMLQTIRKDLHVLSLQRRASTRMLELRSARRVADQSSTDKNNDQRGYSADGATHTHGLKATLDSAAYIERFPKPSKPDRQMAKLKHFKSLQTPTITLSFQQPPEKTITQLTSRQPEGFQAHPERANLEVFKTSELHTSISDQTIKAECQPINQITVCCRGGGFLRHRLQEVSDSRSCTLTSFSKSTVVKRLDDPSPDTEPDEHASHHPDELEITYQDLNEPFSDSEDTDLISAGCEDKDKTEYQDLNEPSSDSDDPDQISDGHDADVLETPYQDLNEPSSDSEDQDQTSVKDSDQGSDSADQCDKAFSDQGFDDADQVKDSLPDQAVDEADEPDSDQYEEPADDSDQFEEPAYESDQFEQPVSERAGDDTDAFDEPSSDQDASEQADDDADEYDEPVSDTEGPEEDTSDADE